MNRDDIKAKVVETVRNLLKVEGEIQDNTSFVKDLACDSLDVVELVMALEEAFDMTIGDDDIYTIKTVGDIVDYIVNHG
ncbi:MAG: acyl carrier protein [Clostridia bacterium]|nr:acyl carrier protein [Clostridia bacterium]